MHNTGWRGSAVAAATVLLVAGPVAAAETRDNRIAEVTAAKIELQRSLGEWLAGSLSKPAMPFRVDPVVQVILRGEVRELQQQEETVGGDVKFGGKTSMKLPGLGYADAGGNNTPEVTLRGPGKRTTRTLRQLDMYVDRLVVRLFVDPAMPKDRRELIRALASDLAGIEPSRGDELMVADLPAAAAVASIAIPSAVPGGAPQMVSLPTAGGDRRLSGLELVAMSLTALAFAVILAYGLSRRAAGAPGAGGAVGRGDQEEGGVEIVDGRVVDIKSGGHAATSERSREGGAFPALADASPRELAELLGDVPPAVAAAIVETRGMSDETSKAFYGLVPAERQLEIGLWLGRGRVIARTELAEMEAAAAAGLARVRSRVSVGGANRLADFLSAAPDEVRSRLLEEVAAKDAAMADAARASMVVFADLGRLSDRSVRRVVVGIDPGVVALALVGAPDDLRQAVLGAVSKRLRGIIESEGEAVAERPAKDVEAARRLLERAMFQLHTRGELVPRAA
jgi:hypothetical protein